MTTEKWTSTLDQMTVKFRETFGNLTKEELNRKPGKDRWSIAQNIDHLMKINSSYFPILDQIDEGTYRTPFLGKVGFFVRLMGNWIMSSVDPDRRKKTKTFSPWEPVESEIDEDILDQFETHQQILKEKMRKCTDALDKDLVINSPVNKNIVYRLDQAFDIIVTHEERHFRQAKETMEELGIEG